MEDIELKDLVLKAFELLKNKFPDMPKKGLLAGGALANTINKLKYPDSKCMINDIDIFVMETEHVEDVRKLVSSDRIYNTTKDVRIFDKYYEQYNNILSITETSRVIKINSSERKSIFNIVRYDINSYDPFFLLETFDINCCAVAFDLETTQIYYTQDFKEYIETKQLKVSRPNSPSHTCLRLLKKRDELNALLDVKEEFKFLQLANDSHILGDVRYFFADAKYLDIYNKYKYEISEYFTLKPKINTEYISYRLYPVLPKKLSDQQYIETSIRGIDFGIFRNKMNIKDFTYFYRNVRLDKNKLNIWKELNYFYKSDNYLENSNIETEDYKLVVNYLDQYNATKLSLAGMNLVEQIKCISTLKNLFNKDKRAETVLEFYPNSLKNLYKDEEQLTLEMRIYQIKYREDIYKLLNYRNTPILEYDYSNDPF